MITVLVPLPFWVVAVLWISIGYLLAIASLYVYNRTNGLIMGKEPPPTHVYILSHMLFINGSMGFIEDLYDTPGLYTFLCCVGMPVKLFFTFLCTLIFLAAWAIHTFSFLPRRIKDKKY
jgi:hypothetical protein